MFNELEKRLLNFLNSPPSERSVQFSRGLAVGSLKGPERNENQDRALVAVITEHGFQPKIIAVVCDGLGGMSQGSRAAEIALSSFINAIVQQHSALSETVLRNAINHANRIVFGEVKGEGGATLAAVVFEPGSDVWITHVGDSRVYSSTLERQLRLHTKDDTIASLAKTDSPSLEDELDNRLLQFVGSASDIEPHISKNVNFTGRFLVTTDGAHGLGKNILEGIERSASSCADWIKKLTYIADATSVRDNATAISISIEEMGSLHGLPIEGKSIKLWSATEVIEICFSESAPFATEQAFDLHPDLPVNRVLTNKDKPPLRKHFRNPKTGPSGSAAGTLPKPKNQLKIVFKDNAD